MITSSHTHPGRFLGPTSIPFPGENKKKGIQKNKKYEPGNRVLEVLER